LHDYINEIEGLFKQYHKVLCNITSNIVNDRAAAEDIVQDVFMNLWRKRNEIDFAIPMKGYLYRATTNGALNWIAKNKRTIPFNDALWKQNVLTSNVVEDKINEKELRTKIKQAIDRLPPKCKAIFVLSRYEGMKYKQIAENLNISIKTVENQISIALDKLRKELKPYLTSTLLIFLAFLIFLFLS